jgi:hypothetical protein
VFCAAVFRVRAAGYLLFPFPATPLGTDLPFPS